MTDATIRRSRGRRAARLADDLRRAALRVYPQGRHALLVVLARDLGPAACRVQERAARACAYPYRARRCETTTDEAGTPLAVRITL